MKLDQSILPKSVHVGTSSFSAVDWSGAFYPSGLKPHDFLSHYAQVFRTVEINATWHFMPNPKTVEGWEKKVPDGFVFAVKVPKVITHEKHLEDCWDDWKYFIETMQALGPKLGPLLFQFKYVAKRSDPKEYSTGADFMRRLEAFIPKLPDDFQYVVEIRNPAWLTDTLTEMLRARGIALALVDYFTMPRPAEWFERCNPITADFSYVRFLGHHRSMDNLIAKKREEEGKTGDWNEVLVDRTGEMREWVPILSKVSDETPNLFAYFNNHYAGFAPGSIELFLSVWEDMAGKGK